MNFHKLFLIIKREYITRLRSKTFIISTILAPIIILAIILIPILLTNFNSSSQNQQFVIVDHTGEIAQRLIKKNPKRYTTEAGVSIDSLKSQVLAGKINGFIVITREVISGDAQPELIYSGGGGIMLTQDISYDIQNAIRDELLSMANVGPDVKMIMKRSVSLQTKKLTKSGEKEQNNAVLFGVGYVMAFGIYTAMLIYGTLIMRGVVEEKTSRIMEVMASSARPFELLFGKVLGVGALGATQFIIWSVSISAITSFMVPLVMHFMGSPTEVAAAATQAASSGFHMPSISISLWIYFILLFILGYLMYSAMFAAIGSAADSESDIQQLSFPVTLPIIIPILLLMRVASDPDSTMAIVTSMIPLFTPILMIARLAVTDVPLWQVWGSIFLMLLTFFGLMWVSSRIYRVGILMYGKKPSFREIAKWIRYS